MSIPVTIQSVPITVTVQDQAPIVVTISAVNTGTVFPLYPQVQLSSQLVPTGYSTTVQTRYQITGTQNLTIQGTGIFAVR